MTERGTGGSAGSSGYDYQARAIAYVASHMLLGQPLEWTRRGHDVPVAIEAEVGRSGDDIQIEFADPNLAYSAQVKRQVQGKAKLREAMDGFVHDLVDAPNEAGILIVGPTTPGNISRDLAEDLDRLRDGRAEPLRDMAQHLLATLETNGQRELHSRLYVVQLALETDSAEGRKAAIRGLLPLVGGDWTSAVRLWDALVSIGHELMSKRGRQTLGGLQHLLGHRGFRLGAAEPNPADELLTLVREMHSAAGLGASAGISVPGAAPDRGGPTDAREAAWQAQLELARDLLDSHSPAAALRALQGLDGTLEAAEPRAAADLRRRVRSNIGVALVRLGRFEDAAPVFEGALEFGPDDPVTLANLARVEYYLDRPERAAQHARHVLRNHPENAKAWGVLLELGEESLASVPPAIASDPSVLTAAGFRALRDGAVGDGPRAVEYFRQAATVDPDPTQLYLLTYSLTHGHLSSTGRLNADPTVLEEAEAVATRALELLGSEPGFSMLHEQLLLLRATVRRSLGREIQAYEDAEQALRLHPPDAPEGWRPLVLCAGLLLDRGNAELALGLLRSPATDEGVGGVHLLRARALVALGRMAEVGDVVERAMELGGDEEDLPLAAVEVALTANLPDLAERVLGTVPPDRAGWIGELLAGRIAAQRGDLEGAARRFSRAADAADPDDARRVRYELAMLFAKANRMDAAVEQLRAADAWTLDPSCRAPYLSALLEAGRFEEVHAKIASLEAEGPLPVWASRAAARVADLRDDVPELVRRLEDIRAVQPGDTRIGVRLASSYADQGRREDALRLFNELLAQPALTPEERMHSAHQIFQLGRRDEAVWQAFRAVRQDQNSPALQRAFVGVVTWHEQTGRAFYPEEVGPDTHVVLEPVKHGDEVAYTLLSEEPVDNQRNEFLARDPRLTMLWRKRVDDHVVLHRNQPNQATYRVKEIKSVVVHLYQDIFLHFGERFPDDASIQKFSIGDEPTIESLAPIIEQLRGKAEQSDTALERYDKHGFPLGVVASMVGTSLDVLYAGLVARGRPFRTEFGSPEELDGSLRAAARKAPIVLGASALFTARRLSGEGVDPLSLLLRLDRPILIPQALIRELEERRTELERALGKGYSTWTAGASGIDMQEVSPEAVAREHEAMTGTLEWLRLHATVRPRPLAALAGSDLQRREVVGESSHDSLELVASEDADLFADDLGLRVYGAVGRQSFSTCALLRSASDRNLLSDQELRRGLVGLIRLNHTFVQLNAKILMGALRDSEFRVDDSAAALLARLGEANVYVPSAITVAVGLLSQLATTREAEGKRSSVTQAVLEALTSARPIRSTMRSLQRELDRRMKGPEARGSVQQEINLFVRGRAPKG